jgi:5-hydroxyisourate hydrolase
MTGFLTTHVLDTANGCPAAGMVIELWAIAPDRTRHHHATFTTNLDGRTDTPVLPPEQFAIGQYELIFAVADYFRDRATPQSDPPFLDHVPIAFSIADLTSHYHVPLLVSPWAYSTYRGS